MKYVINNISGHCPPFYLKSSINNINMVKPWYAYLLFGREDGMKRIWILGIIALTLLVSAFGAVAESNASSTSDNKTPWTGVWHSELYAMTITQDENDISCPYALIDSSGNDTGIIKGTVSDNASVVTGTWNESGDIILIPSDDNSTLDGNWAYTSEPEHFKKSDGESTLAGTWNSPNMTLSLLKDGLGVSGTYHSLREGSNARGYLNATTVQDSKKIAGTFVEGGNIAFIISDDGSFFNGTYTYGQDVAKEDDTWNAVRIS
jgi:hypothetical protein